MASIIAIIPFFVAFSVITVRNSHNKYFSFFEKSLRNSWSVYIFYNIIEKPTSLSTNIWKQTTPIIEQINYYKRKNILINILN